MAKASRIYSRLTRTTAGLGSYSSLWRGPDHLLIAKSTGYTEEYSRILFRDIRAVFIVDSARQAFWYIPWVVIALIGALIAIFGVMDGMTGGAPMGGIILLFLGLLFSAVNFSLGPGCKVYLWTGVQNQELSSIVRRKQAMKVLDRVRPVIEAAQENIS